jgi:hypothetical protein
MHREKERRAGEVRVGDALADCLVADLREHGVHHPEKPDPDWHRDVSHLHPVERCAETWKGSPEQEAERHRRKDPERKEPVERR